MARKVAGPGRLGSVKAVKQSLKKGGVAGVKNIPANDSITVRFLDEPEDWHGYYEHWMKPNNPIPCATDECDGCESDDPEEQRKNFRYLANAYVVDDQKVWAVKLPKSLVEILMNFHAKYKGTLLDRDYDLSKSGSGKEGTKYMAAPDDKQKMDLSRFDKKKYNLSELLSAMLNGDVEEDDDDEDDDEPMSKPKKSKSKTPWDDDEDKPRKKKKTGVKKKSASRKPVKRTVKRSR